MSSLTPLSAGTDEKLIIDRRLALKMLAALGAGLSGCGRQPDRIIPYVDMPERVVPGEPLKFATSLALAGYGRGVIGTCHQGRPTKLEGNRRHPASLGGADMFMEAEILNLYDSARARIPRGRSPVESWNTFSQSFASHAGESSFDLRILTGRVTSPTFARVMRELRESFPAARWHRHEPIHDDNEIAGNRLAFGRPLLARPRLEQATAICCLGADPLGPGPEQPALARGWARERIAAEGGMTRLYSIESAWTLTGAAADHRLALPPAGIMNFADALARHIAGPSDAGDSAAIIARDLLARRAQALVLAGRDQPPELHALAAWINQRLDAPIAYVAPADPVPESHADSMAELVADLQAGRVGALIVIDANPVYHQGPHFAELIRRARFSAQLSLYEDETSAACDWHLPMSHGLESWSDLRAPDGTASIVQPLITPLYDSRTPLALLRMMMGAVANDYDDVRATWRPEAGSGDFEDWWRGTLETGVVAGSAAPILNPPPAIISSLPRPESSVLRPEALRPALVATPDPATWDGRFANNAWLQECPDPFTKQVWGNAIGLSPADAEARGLTDGDPVRIERGGAFVDGPILVRHGQAAGVVAVTLGQGRRVCGPIGKGIGYNAFPLLSADGPLSLRRQDSGGALHVTYGHAGIDAEMDKLYPLRTPAELAGADADGIAAAPPQPSLLPPQTASGDGNAWAMVIDNARCIGCNACVVACQAENNIPVVGPGEIDRHRDMHWLRVDVYERFHNGQQRIGFEPVPCMQCENAPCEPVCPVEASVHDQEGLNVQVYNRCIGTRFCQANCPYKVRRFNWFDYAGDQAYADMDAGTASAQRNPDVTVRTRGVMEKCTYCVQRISRARRAAEKENRPIRDGEMFTACQAACPTQAISFGNLLDPQAAIHQKRGDKRHFTLLRELGTRPRTTYLADIVNPNPDWPASDDENLS